ncbi:MAG: UDP-N-acetylmuramate--L-alanine ligase [Leptospira sp.]|nr:UDP-N-acetylmuramate--L-alanine ligase [Leptospira sp.]
MKQTKTYFILGIGGSGMSSLAHILLDAGMSVIGYDKSQSQQLSLLRSRGVTIYSSPEEFLANQNSISIDFTVHSSAIKSSPLLDWSKKNNIQIQHRSKTMHDFFSKKRSISIAGSHGKTTTTGMVSQMLMDAGKDPAIMIGGESSILADRGGRWGQGDWGVYESDESDGTFLNHKADYRLLINIDDDHLDFYKTKEKLMEAFLNYISVDDQSTMILFADDPGVKECLNILNKGKSFIKKNIIAIGNVPNPKDFKKVYSFSLNGQYGILNDANSDIKFTVPFLGDHYRINASLAIALGMELGIDLESILNSIASYKGVKRRMEILFHSGNKTIIDDYGHHPTEVLAVLKGIQAEKLSDPNKETIVIFQPHRYTRTKNLYKEFASSLKAVDRILLLPIYAAGEEPMEGINTQLIVNELKRLGKDSILLSGNIQEDLANLLSKLPPSYTLVTLGAGNVREWGLDLAESLNIKPISETR